MIIDSKTLKKELAFVGKSVSSRPIMPILSNVLFVLENNVATITCSNLETTCRSKMQCNGDDISFCVDFEQFNSIISSQDGSIDLSINGTKLVIKTGNGKYLLPINDTIDFPLNKLSEKSSVKIDFCDFKNKIISVSDSIIVDDSLPVLSGVLIKGSDIVGMNKNFMTISTLEGLTECGSIILPKSVIGIVSSIADHDGISTINIGDNGVEIICGNKTISSLLIDGTYPDYSIIVNSINTPDQIRVNRSLLVSAINKITTVSKLNSGVIVLSLNGNKLTIACESIDFGVSGEEELDVVGSLKTTIKMNSKFLGQALRSRYCNFVDIKISNKAIVITGDDNITSLIAAIV